MNISVKSVHFHADSKLVSHVQKKLTRLGKLYDRIVDVEVFLKLQDNGSKVQEKIAEIRMHVPGGWLMDKKTGKSFESAINASTETLRRQLTRYKERFQDHSHEKVSERRLSA